MNQLPQLALDVTNLTVQYEARAILKGLELKVRRGEIYALLGGNGAGKSTTINAILGFLKATSGQVRVCGIDVLGDPKAARASMAYVPENVALYEFLSARENVAYFLRVAGASGGAQEIDAALAAVGLVQSAWNERLGSYSKGMRQKVAIALALARSVPVLLLDEPTSGLDPHATSEFNALLQRLRERGVTTLMVSHDLLSAIEVADRIGFLSDGVIGAEYAASGAQRFDIGALYRHYGSVRVAA
jgi:ABC-2 type transport system ATP-binding protein